MNDRELILKCIEVNSGYMRLPAGQVAGLENMVALYKRVAEQSLECARAWAKDSPCPAHEPATDAFWWGVVAWADGFGLSMGVDQAEWGRLFVSPHEAFANYLRPARPPTPLPAVDGPPANIILALDALWTELVIKLTARWGLLHHLKDKGAIIEAQRLQGELQNPDSPTYRAFLESDLTFFHALFKHFPFSKETRKHIDDWLKKAEEAL